MKQRAIAILADYLARRPKGRVVRVLQTGEDDYVMGIEDARDGRIHLVHDPHDLETWLECFRQGRCLQPAAAICDVCDGIHADRGFDGELLRHCASCQIELTEILADLDERRCSREE